MGRPPGEAGGALCLSSPGPGCLLAFSCSCGVSTARRLDTGPSHTTGSRTTEMNRVSNPCSVPLLECLHVSLTWFRLALQGALPKSTGPHPRSVEALNPPGSGSAPQSFEISHTHVQFRPQPSRELPHARSLSSLQAPPLPPPGARQAPPLLRGRHAPSSIQGSFNSKTPLQWKVGILFPVSSLASGSGEGTGPLSAYG